MSRIGKVLVCPVAPAHATLHTALWAVAAAVMLAAAGWRWHAAAVAAPVLIPGAEGPAIILAVQQADCPDRRAFMEGWVAEFSEPQSPGPGTTLYLARVHGAGLPLAQALDTLPEIEEDGAAAAARVLRRAGVVGTPALVVVDPGGRPVLTAGFGENHLELAAPDALVRALEIGSRARTADNPLDPTRMQEAMARWNP